MKQIKVYGTHTCSDCVRTKKWLHDHEISFEDIFIEESYELVEKVLSLTHGDTRTPVIVFPDGSFLVEPTNDQLAKKLL